MKTGTNQYSYLIEKGFERRKCTSCGAYFWTLDGDRKTCGDPPCDTYSFIGNPPLKERDLDDMRESYLSFFERHGHKRIEPYPVVARWRDDIYLTIASIADFQPFVTSGEVPPPANPLTISQPSIRLDDLDSVGKSGRHLTGFEMMAHHAFNFEEEIYWIDDTVRYCNELLIELGADPASITYKEDFWEGGGNAGPCLEALIGGLELATLVFMDLVVEAGEYKPMDNRIVDTGYGLERFVWASKGSATVYDAIFPETIETLRASASVDEPGAMDKIYAIADHSRCIAWMLADGLVPSNAEAGYLARLVLRRTLRMMESLSMDMSLSDVVSLHRPLEDHIHEMIDLETKRYKRTIERGKSLITRKLEDYAREQKEVPAEEMMQLYDSHGVPPEMIKEISHSFGVKAEIPGDFYSLIAQTHSQPTTEEEPSESLPDLPKTKKLYYEYPFASRFKAKLLGTFNNKIVLDQTLFYPEGGGQPADTGYLLVGNREIEVKDVQEVNGVILHETAEPIRGEEVEGIVDFERRMALTRNHSATHIIGNASRKVLGPHIWQAGAKKGVESSRLDITHFKRISEEAREIEKLANLAVMKDSKINISWLDRNEAERRYGFVLYQGGVVPGEKVRVVKVGDDVQACAGTHCNSTGEIGTIKILSTERIQDGIERIEFSVGEAAIKHIQEKDEIVNEASETLRVPISELSNAITRFFDEWKDLRKENVKLKKSLAKYESEDLEKEAIDIEGIKVVAKSIQADDEELKAISLDLKERNSVAILISNGRTVVAVPSNLSNQIDASTIANEVCTILGGGGGGNPEFAQGGGKKIERTDEALRRGVEAIHEMLHM